MDLALVKEILAAARELFGDEVAGGEDSLLLAFASDGNGAEWVLLVRDPTITDRVCYLTTFNASSPEKLFNALKDCKMQKLREPKPPAPSQEWRENFVKPSEN